jgi:hypothetical protein
MHHSEDPGRKAFPLICYCDDSASHEPSQNAVIGGFLLSKDAFCAFNSWWLGTLHRYGVKPPFKVKNLSNIGLYPEMRLALVRELVQIVNYHKFYSLSVLVPQKDFKSLLSMDIYRRLLSPYTFAFLSAVMVNHMYMEEICKNAPEQNGIVSYLHDAGSHYADQLDAGYRLILEWQRNHRSSAHTGAMAVDTDDNISALQAADMIAWAINRKSTVGLVDEFEGLENLFGSVPYSSIDGRPTGKSNLHFSIDISSDGIQMLADGINLWLDAGIMPESLAEMGIPPHHLLG